MENLKRITKGSICNLVEDLEIIDIGDGVIKGSRWTNTSLKLKISKETRKIYTSPNIVESKESIFLKHIDELLEKKNMYLAHLDYKPYGLAGFLPHVLKGRFYVENKK